TVAPTVSWAPVVFGDFTSRSARRDRRTRDFADDSAYTPAPFEEGLPVVDDDEFEDEEAEPSEPEDIDAELDEDEFASDLDVDVDDVDIDDVEDVLVDDSDEVGTLDEEAEDEEDEVVDLEEELHPDDVEEPLDVLLLERTSGLLDEEEYDEDEDDSEADDRADPSSRIPPKRPGEFVCRSCFLVKHPSQLADAERMLCADCV